MFDTNSKNSFEEKTLDSKKSNKDLTKHLYVQIQEIPELIQQAKAIDHILFTRLQDLKTISSNVIEQFNKQKKAILQRFDHWIMPIAKDVLDKIFQDAEQRRAQLHTKFDQADHVTADEWQDEAQYWTRLHTNGFVRKELISKILETVSMRTQYLVDRDIQIIKDYQTQSLSHLSKESETFKSIEKRLAHVIEEPLKQLMALRNQVKEHTSIQQASEWVAKLQERREGYFDQLLMKIDQVTKDVVHIEPLNDRQDWALFLEVEGELVFMESELHDINKDLTYIHMLEESDKQFILGRLEGLLDHVQQMNEFSLPVALQKRVQVLKEGIFYSLARLQ